MGTLLFSLIACNEEYEEVQPTERNAVTKHFKIKKVDFNEISQNTALFKKLNKLNKGKKTTHDSNGKVVFSAENDFYIDTDFATYIENENGGHSYTFLIKRDSADIKLENLILTSNDTINYKMYIAQYDITDEEFAQLESGQNPDISCKTTLIPVNDNQLFNNLFSKVLIVNLGSGDCIIDVNFIGGVNCPCNNHSYGQSCQCHTLPTPDQWIYTWGSCGGGGGSSGGDSTGSGDGIGTGNYGGSGGGSGACNHNDEVDTTPVFELEDELDNSCDLILKLQQDTNFKSRMAALITPARNWNFERVTIIKENPTPTATNNYSYENHDGNQNSPSAVFPFYTNYVGYLHTHYSGTGSIFSGKDLQYLYNLLKNNPTYFDNIFLGLVTSYNTAYLLQINDRAAFIAFGDKYLASDSDTNKFEVKYMYGKYGIHQNSSNDTNENGFLKMMNDLNIGISLASCNLQSLNTPLQPSPDLFNSWTKLKWDKKLNKKTTSKCM